MAILVVDDSVEDRLLVESVLGSAGYTDVLTAASPRHAFQLLGIDGGPRQLAPGRIDLILIDTAMPELRDGDARGTLAEHARLRDIPIIAMTPTGEPGELEDALAAGVVDYVGKPPQRIELLARVRACLRLKREIERRRAIEQQAREVARLLDAAYQRLQHISFLDGLTGIANRRRFDEFLHNEWRRALRGGSSLSLVMIDIDYFKAFNDTYGHQAGDECLTRVASALQGALRRAGDLVARYGGEEFVAVLPATPADGALAVAQTLRERVEALGVAHRGSPVSDRVTISLGVATTVPSRATSAAALVAAADRALYQAKREGRNCVRAAAAEPAISAGA
jgi:diguanylate cyclase (GGDEF)-like protein